MAMAAAKCQHGHGNARLDIGLERDAERRTLLPEVHICNHGRPGPFARDLNHVSRAPVTPPPLPHSRRGSNLRSRSSSRDRDSRRQASERELYKIPEMEVESPHKAIAAPKLVNEPMQGQAVTWVTKCVEWDTNAGPGVKKPQLFCDTCRGFKPVILITMVLLVSMSLIVWFSMGRTFFRPQFGPNVTKEHQTTISSRISTSHVASATVATTAKFKMIEYSIDLSDRCDSDATPSSRLQIESLSIENVLESCTFLDQLFSVVFPSLKKLTMHNVTLDSAGCRLLERFLRQARETLEEIHIDDSSLSDCDFRDIHLPQLRSMVVREREAIMTSITQNSIGLP